MRIDWDADAGVLYVAVGDSHISKQWDRYPVIADVDDSGELVGFEVILPARVESVSESMAEFGVGSDVEEAVIQVLVPANIRAMHVHPSEMRESTWLGDKTLDRSERSFVTAG